MGQALTRRRSSTKKALLVGICHDNQTEDDQEFESIPTSIPDVRKFKQFLQGVTPPLGPWYSYLTRCLHTV